MDPLVSIGTIGQNVQNDIRPMDVQWTSNGTNGRPMDSPMDQMRFHFLLTLLPKTMPSATVPQLCPKYSVILRQFCSILPQ